MLWSGGKNFLFLAVLHALRGAAVALLRSKIHAHCELVVHSSLTARAHGIWYTAKGLDIAEGSLLGYRPIMGSLPF